ncbi:CheW domain-containing protein WspB, partial [Pseudomonas savastanoi pv. glycinea]
ISASSQFRHRRVESGRGRAARWRFAIQGLNTPMTDQSPRRNGTPLTTSKLFLLFCIGEDRYALDATEIAEILPRVKLKAIAQAPHWVA